MFKSWQQEKATTALIDEAQAVCDRLQSAKSHIVEARAAAAQFWAVSYHAQGQDLQTIATWTPPEVKRFITAAQTKIAALRKQRHYDSSDGLAVWLHTARAVTEPRIMPAVLEIWHILNAADSNADDMANDMLQDASLPPGDHRITPQGFE